MRVGNFPFKGELPGFENNLDYDLRGGPNYKKKINEPTKEEETPISSESDAAHHIKVSKFDHFPGPGVQVNPIKLIRGNNLNTSTMLCQNAYKSIEILTDSLLKTDTSVQQLRSAHE